MRLPDSVRAVGNGRALGDKRRVVEKRHSVLERVALEPLHLRYERMVRVHLEDALFVRDVLLHRAHHADHRRRERVLLLDEAARRIDEARGDANVGDVRLKFLLHGVEERLQVLRRLFVRVLLRLLLGLGPERHVALRDVDELLSVELAQRLGEVFVDRVAEEQHVAAVLPRGLELGRAASVFLELGDEIVDVLLS